jgi:hypothetical protein
MDLLTAFQMLRDGTNMEQFDQRKGYEKFGRLISRGVRTPKEEME